MVSMAQSGAEAGRGNSTGDGICWSTRDEEAVETGVEIRVEAAKVI